jgi:hypothetical protein
MKKIIRYIALDVHKNSMAIEEGGKLRTYGSSGTDQARTKFHGAQNGTRAN